MKSLSAREAKYDLGRLTDIAHAALAIEKHHRSNLVVLSLVVLVLSIEEYEGLGAIVSKKETV